MKQKKAAHTVIGHCLFSLRLTVAPAASLAAFPLTTKLRISTFPK